MHKGSSNAKTQKTRKFKASTGWCIRMMRHAGLTLRRCTNLAQSLPGEYAEELVEFQRYVKKLRKQHMHMLGHIENTDKTPLYCYMCEVSLVVALALLQQCNSTTLLYFLSYATILDR
jgi:hypothetical protein